MAIMKFSQPLILLSIFKSIPDHLVIYVSFLWKPKKTFPIYFSAFQRTSQRHSSLCGGLLVLWRFFHFLFLLSTRKLPPSSRFIFLKSAISSRRYILLWMPRRHLLPLIHLLFPWKGKESLEDLLEFRAIQARSTLLDLDFLNFLKWFF